MNKCINQATSYLGRTFQYRRLNEDFFKLAGIQQGEVVSVIVSQPQLGRGLELCFSDDPDSYHVVGSCIELVAEVSAGSTVSHIVTEACCRSCMLGFPAQSFTSHNVYYVKFKMNRVKLNPSSVNR